MSRPCINISHSCQEKGRPSGLLIFLLLLLAQVSVAQPSGDDYLRLNRQYLVSYFEDAGAVATAPARWQGDQWLGFGAVAAGTGIAIAFDDEINEFFQRQRNDQIDGVTKHFLDPLGNYYLAGILGGMYIVGLAAGNKKTETAALLTSKAVVITGAYTFLFKAAFQRERPAETGPSDSGNWGGPFAGFHDNAFPSGHSSVAFAAATVLSSYYRDHLWVGITTYTLASLVAMSRIYDNKHWASDVVAGAALGYAIGRTVLNRHHGSRLKIGVFKNSFGTGMKLTYSLK